MCLKPLQVQKVISYHPIPSNELFALHTGQDKKKVGSDTERDFFMTGQEALEYGIVDKVITKREMITMEKNNKKKVIHTVDRED